MPRGWKGVCCVVLVLRENSWREGHSFIDSLGFMMITQVLNRLDVTKFEFYLRLNKDFPET